MQPESKVLRPPLIGAFLIVALSATVAAAAPPPRVVAVGDVHADLPALKAVLTEAGVLDARGAWSGGNTILVQLGDLVDRGPAMRATLDFMIALERQAAKHGGRSVAILGNHEVMNVIGDLRYVTPGNFAEFADAGSEIRRAAAWKQYVAYRKRQAGSFGQPEPELGEAEEQAWLAAHPPGRLEHREAFGPKGKYGRWLRSRPAAFVFDGTAFVHGGVSPALAVGPLSMLDQRLHEELAAFEADRQALVEAGVILPFFDIQGASAAAGHTLDILRAAIAAEEAAAAEAGRKAKVPKKAAKLEALLERFVAWKTRLFASADGPLWYRGYSQWTDEEGAPEIARVLAASGVKRFVVGHTPQPDARVRVRFGGTVFLLDTGMLAAYYKGRGSALELEGGTATAIYAGEGRQVVWPAPAPTAAPTAAPAERSEDASP